jgi:hypothetical protein
MGEHHFTYTGDDNGACLAYTECVCEDRV